MSLIGQILILAINIYMLIIILEVIVNWLIVFGVLNARNDQAQNLLRAMSRATDPVYKPIRKYVPAIGGIDLSPLIVILGLELLKYVIAQIFFYPMGY